MVLRRFDYFRRIIVFFREHIAVVLRFSAQVRLAAISKPSRAESTLPAFGGENTGSIFYD